MHAFQQRLLKRAVEIAGGMRPLCARLGVSDHALGLWLQGKVKIPERVFLAAADLVLEDDIARAAQDRRSQPRFEAFVR
jgi:DNA-binding transcriptional regulator YdaS (Cro superfamily)